MTTKTATMDRRAALGSLAAAGALLVAPKLAKADEMAAAPDPALAAIDRHKAAAEALGLFYDEFADLPEWEPETDAEHRRLERAQHNALWDLAKTTPTTREGARAALAYLVREAGDQHFRLMGVFAGRLIAAKWPAEQEA